MPLLKERRKREICGSRDMKRSKGSMSQPMLNSYKLRVSIEIRCWQLRMLRSNYKLNKGSAIYWRRKMKSFRQQSTRLWPRMRFLIEIWPFNLRNSSNFLFRNSNILTNWKSNLQPLNPDSEKYWILIAWLVKTTDLKPSTTWTSISNSKSKVVRAPKL